MSEKGSKGDLRHVTTVTKPAMTLLHKEGEGSKARKKGKRKKSTKGHFYRSIKS